jgi:hypothetical protein
MINKIKPLLLIIVLFLIAFFIGFRISQKENRPQSSQMPTPTDSVSPQVTPQPLLPTFIPNAPKNVLFSFIGQPLQYPSKLNIYGFAPLPPPSWPDKSISPIAETLGFTTVSSKIQNDKIFSLVWTKDSSELVYSRSSLSETIAYRQYLPQKSSTPASADTASLFIKKTFAFPQNLELSALPDVSNNFADLPIRDTPRPALLGFSFSYLIENTYPLLLNNYEIPSALVILDNNGAVRSATYSFPPNEVKPIKETNIITVNQAVDNLNLGFGTLVSSVATDEWGLQTHFSSVSLTSAILCYLADKTSRNILPFYLFSGTGLSEEKTINIKYIISALP